MSPVSVALLVAARDVFLLILDGGDRHLANSGDGKENGLDPLQCLCEEHRLHLQSLFIIIIIFIHHCLFIPESLRD